MNHSKFAFLIAIAALLAATSISARNDNVVEEVVWVVGDQPIWKSEVEEAYQQLLYEKTPIKGDPYCVIPEQLAIEKLYLHQADLDTIEVPESSVAARVDAYLNDLINNLGSKEKVEQVFGKPYPVLRQQLRETQLNRARVSYVQENLTKKLTSTPADIRRYFDKLPADSVPWVPQQVEVQIMTIAPAIPREAVEDVKARLREYSDAVNKGESQFSTLATLYSQDPGSATRGGELGFMGRAELVPEFAAVAFNLSDPKKVSKIVETEYGYHIIQLIEKRGDRVNVRHILLTPKVSESDLLLAVNRMDTLRNDISDKKINFEEAVAFISQDKDTRNNRGMMVNPATGSTRWQMSELPQEVAKAVSNMQPGDISEAFIMTDPKLNREVVAMVKLASRLEGHKANLADDYQQIKGMYEEAKRSETLRKWLADKIKNTYTRVEEGWRDCNFSHEGWIKTQ